MDRQLLGKTLFPLPSLKTVDNHSVFYMKPARYHPKNIPTRAVLDSLAYTMNSMLDMVSLSQSMLLLFVRLAKFIITDIFAL